MNSPQPWPESQQVATPAEILVIEDHLDVLKLLSSMLGSAGYRVRAATGGQIALTTVGFKLPDLILLDIHMPQMDGYEVCRHLKADPKTRAIPIIFISASHQVVDKVKALHLGAVDYIDKPFHVEEVLARVNTHLTLRQLFRQVERLNSDLERQVKARTLKLQQSLDLEALLRRIVDKVRESLDEGQILQTVVAELAVGLDAYSCDLGLHDLDQQTVTICYEHLRADLDSVKGKQFQLAAQPDLYAQLLKGQPIQISHERQPLGQVAALGCPLIDEQQVVGGLWLERSAHSYFDLEEVRLVQQVASHCVIGIRQARLFKAAQNQVVELERINRLKDDFVSTVSHELRTPLTTVLMALRMMNMAPTQDKQQQYYEMAVTHCQQEITLINDLLDLQRLEVTRYPIQEQVFDLKSWLTPLIEPIQQQTAKLQQTLDVELSLSEDLFCTDSEGLERILRELLLNACKHTPAQGRIRLGVKQTPAQVEFEISNTASIADAELPRIFDKFYRVTDADRWKRGGTGLGLALVREWVSHLRGKLKVTSEAGWTTFVVQIPNAG